jgi:predicted Fe-Mo cluster-binding NifX family protein
MRIAVAAAHGRVSPLLDVARSVVVVEVERGTRRSLDSVSLDTCDPLENTHRLSGLQMDVLICGAVSQQLAALLRAYEIHVIAFVTGEVDAVVDAYLKGRLPGPTFAMPGSWRGCDDSGDTETQGRGDQ